VDWIRLAVDKFQRRSVLNTVTDISVSLGDSWFESCKQLMVLAWYPSNTLLRLKSFNSSCKTTCGEHFVLFSHLYENLYYFLSII
jgi:hypothetical protein